MAGSPIWPSSLISTVSWAILEGASSLVFSSLGKWDNSSSMGELDTWFFS